MSRNILMYLCWRLWTSKALVLRWGDRFPKEPFINVWRRVWWSWLGELLAAHGWSPGTLLNSLQCTGWPPTENDPAPNVSSTKVESSCSKMLLLPFHGKRCYNGRPHQNFSIKASGEYLYIHLQIWYTDSYSLENSLNFFPLTLVDVSSPDCLLEQN